MVRGRRSFVATVLAVGTAGCVSSGIETNTTVDTNDDTEVSTDGEGELTVEETPEFEGVRYGDYSDIRIENVGAEYIDDMGYVTGQFTNEGDTDIERVYLRISEYDADGAINDQHTNTAASIRPDETWSFEIFVGDIDFESYDVKVTLLRWAN